MTRTRITPDEIAEMKRLRKTGLSYAAVGRAVRRASGTVRKFILGIRKPVQKSTTDYQAEARAVPERVGGADAPVDLDSDFSGVGEAQLDLIPEGAAARMAQVDAGRRVKPKR